MQPVPHQPKHPKASGTQTQERLAEAGNGALADAPPAEESSTVDVTLPLPTNLATATAVASEERLRQIWDTPEEDAAWRNL